MSMAYNLRFLTEIENGNIATVQKMVVGGSINVNQPYLSVFPLNLAIESGNIDMVAVLLTASADPLLKFNPKNEKHIKGEVFTAMKLAENMAADPQDKYRMEAAVMVELMNDPKKLEQRFSAVQVRLGAERDRELQLVKRILVLSAAALLLFMGWPYVANLLK